MAQADIIVAADSDGVIGFNGSLPWHYPEDLKRFKQLTLGNTLIMGRVTWESLPKPLLDRRCIVVTRQDNPYSRHPRGSCEYYRSLELALDSDPDRVWVAGGAEIYHQVLKMGVVRYINMTVVPKVSLDEGQITKLPKDFLKGFVLEYSERNNEDERLQHRLYRCLRS